MSTLRRIFIKPDDFRAGMQQLSYEESHYATKVLRLQSGAEVEVFDGAGKLALGQLGPDPTGNTRRTQLTVTLSELQKALRPRRLVVGCACPKGERADWLVEKLAELGVERLDWLTFADSPKSAQQATRSERHDRLALSALRQSRQAFAMQVSACVPMATWLSQTQALAGRKWVAHPYAEMPLIAREQIGPSDPPAFLLIGPEAGLRSAELQQAALAGYTSGTVSRHILRVETAAVVGAAALLA